MLKYLLKDLLKDLAICVITIAMLAAGLWLFLNLLKSEELETTNFTVEETASNNIAAIPSIGIGREEIIPPSPKDPVIIIAESDEANIIAQKIIITLKSDNEPVQIWQECQKYEQERNLLIEENNLLFPKTSFFEGEFDENKFSELLEIVPNYFEEYHPQYSYEDVDLLARLIMQEVGSHWISERCKMLTGQVVLNRVNSNLFPNTLNGVVWQENQYEDADIFCDPSFSYTDEVWEIAKRLCCGEGDIFSTNIVYQAEFKPEGYGIVQEVITESCCCGKTNFTMYYSSSIWES